jgi:hypothetical protein
MNQAVLYLPLNSLLCMFLNYLKGNFVLKREGNFFKLNRAAAPSAPSSVSRWLWEAAMAPLQSRVSFVRYDVWGMKSDGILFHWLTLFKHHCFSSSLIHQRFYLIYYIFNLAQSRYDLFTVYCWRTGSLSRTRQGKTTGRKFKSLKIYC